MTTADPARAVANDVIPLTRSATGNIVVEDAYFLLSLIDRERPSRILEIGVASGTSTLAMLRMLEQHLPATTLDSIDLATSYYADTSKAVGYLVGEQYGVPPKHWTLVTNVTAATFTTAARFAGASRRRYYDFVFIDAHHSHPWPTLDALCVLPFVQPGSWIAFHDINLPLFGDYPHFGPVYVVDDWPGEALVGDHRPIPNIGAIRLTDADGDDVSSLVAMLSRKWDCGVHPYFASKILTHLSTCLSAAHYADVQHAFERNAGLPPG